MAGGALGLRPLQRLADAHDVALVVRPGGGGSALRRAARGVRDLLRPRAPDETAAWLDERRIPAMLVGRDETARLTRELVRTRVDLLCIATFPWLLPDAVTASARLGAINLHASLLPRHRGPNPWLWTYHTQDRHAGVTVHRAVARADAGPVYGQAAHPLPRGYPVAALHAELAELGAGLLADVVEHLAAGTAIAVPQDEAAATRAPRVAPGTSLVRYDTWDVEEVWHFLAGMAGQFTEPLHSGDGAPVAYAVVPSYERGTALAPGTVERADGGWVLHCRGGAVRLAGGEAAPPASRR